MSRDHPESGSSVVSGHLEAGEQPRPVNPIPDDGNDLAPRTLLGLIALRARRNPGAYALLAPGRPPLAFAALVRQIAYVAQSLADAGLGRGSRIALALPGGPELAVMLIAASDCATCAPLNPALDAASCRYLLEHQRIDALVVLEEDDSAVCQAATALGMPVARIAFSAADAAGTFVLTLQTGRRAVAAQTPQPSDIAILLHTSGTTARPKTVPYSSRNLVDSAIARAARMRLTAADRSLLVSPCFAATGIRRSLFPTLGAGGSVVCTSGFDAGRFFAWLEDFQPTFYVGGPTVHRAVADLLDRHGHAPRHALRFVIAASAPLPENVHDLLERGLGVPLLHAYSTTEAGSITESPLPPARHRGRSVGTAASSEIAILGESDTHLPAGEVGEIVVRSAEVFEGYENDPEATSRAFHDGWFRTGDLGYLDADGFLFLTGRVKEIINRGGYKVSPVEIDTMLGSHPEVIESAAFAVPHPTLGEDIAAAVVLRKPGSVTPRQLRDFALANLAPFKVPTRIIVMDALPRTPLGKVQRRELSDLHAQTRAREFLHLTGPNEALVARIFGEELGIDQVGADDNFFELGGDSLRGAQVVLRLNALTGSNLPATSLFRRPTVAGFAAELTAGAVAGEPSDPPPVTRHARRRAPLSPDD